MKVFTLLVSKKMSNYKCELFKADEISNGKLLQKFTIRRISERSSGHVFLMQLHSLTSLVTPVALFSANADDIRLSRSKTVKSSELVSEKLPDVRPMHLRLKNTSQGIKTKRCLVFLIYAFKLLASATKIARKSYFALLYFDLSDSHTYMNYKNPFIVYSTLTLSSHDLLRTRHRTFLWLRT